MARDGLHRRGEVLRSVVDHLEKHHDGRSPVDLPMDLPGVRETFADELALVGALQLRWYTRLHGAIDQETTGPVDLATAVVTAWTTTAAEMPGLRAMLDRYTREPTTAEMADAMRAARRKEWSLLAAMAGLAGPADPAAADIGRTLENTARAALATQGRQGAHGGAAPGRRRAVIAQRPSLLDRVKKAVLAA